jgi:hypothetical protein
MKKFVWIAVIMVVLGGLMPSKTTIYIYLGTKVTISAVDTSLGQKTLKLLEQKIDEALGSSQ